LIPAGGEVVADGSGIGHGSGESVELWHHECVAFAYRGQGLVQAWAGAVGAGESVVEVDALLGDAEFEQPLSLYGQVLRVG
jgi:hypothetical protein